MTARQWAALLVKLEQHHGAVGFAEPTDPYELIVYTNCGYPPSQDNCRRGFEALRAAVGLAPDTVLAATDSALATALKAGGIVPELRASRLKLTARMVIEEFGGDLRRALSAAPAARKALKRFPTIGDPGVDKILLFCAGIPLAAVPSNCLHVPLRLGLGAERPSLPRVTDPCSRRSPGCWRMKRTRCSARTSSCDSMARRFAVERRLCATAAPRRRCVLTSNRTAA